MKGEKEIIREIEHKLKLLFTEESQNGNVCYAYTNEEMRDDFKLSFTRRDLTNFLRSFDGNEIIIPSDTDVFWKRVRAGEKQENS